MLGQFRVVNLFTKKSCLILLGVSSLVVYSFLSSECLVNNVHGLFLAIDSKTIQAPMNVTRVRKNTTYVRLIPLLKWDGSPSASSENSQSGPDDSSKYRLLDKKGLKPTRRLPDALLIGVKKSGTRALLEFLRLHPDVRAAGSEVHFFDRYYLRGFAWYRRKMPPTIQGQLTMEKTPSYFVTKEAPARVKKMNPNTKLLVVVRDPVTRAISDYTQAASKKSKADLKSFECLAFVKDSDFSVVDTSWAPVRIGVYAKHLARWLKYFPLSQMIFVSGERLVADPAAEMARVQDFLGLKRVVTEKHFYFNATKGFPCLLKSEGRSTPHCLGKTKGRNHPVIKKEALDKLREFYRPFNLRFYQLTGIDFGWA